MDFVRQSRRLAYLLRHDKDYKFEEQGYREVDNLIAEHGFTMAVLEAVVERNDKQRFEFNADRTKIRARQGHSVTVDVGLKEIMPPTVLYHGTADKYLESILAGGLVKGTRLHVHLSVDFDTAVAVGRRHGVPVVLTIDTAEMFADGLKFYLSNNGVWLTDSVETRYFLRVSMLGKK